MIPQDAAYAQGDLLDLAAPEKLIGTACEAQPKLDILVDGGLTVAQVGRM